MIRQIIHTLFSKVGVLLFNVALLLITTRLMGAQNKGEISLLLLNLSIIATLSGFFGGPALVYLAPRFKLLGLMLINYVWSIVATLAVLLVIWLGGIYNPIAWPLLFALGLVESLFAVHLHTMLGYEKVKSHNYLQLTKMGLTVFVLLYFFATSESIGFEEFVIAYGAGLSLSFLLSLLVFSSIGKSSEREAGPAQRSTDFVTALRDSFKYGTLVQTGNLAQLFNYRLSIYYLELLISPPELALVRIGIYSAVLQVAESLLQFGKSVGLVQYARLSNMSDMPRALAITLYLAKLNVAVTAAGIIVLALVPASWFGILLGSEFEEVKMHLFWLMPGILALALSNALSHYFAGIGRHRYNMFASFCGLLITALPGWYLVVHFGSYGAAATASVAYLASVIYQMYVLASKDKVRLSQFWPSQADLQLSKEALVHLLKRGKPNSEKPNEPEPGTETNG